MTIETVTTLNHGGNKIEWVQAVAQAGEKIVIDRSTAFFSLPQGEGCFRLTGYWENDQAVVEKEIIPAGTIIHHITDSPIGEIFYRSA